MKANNNYKKDGKVITSQDSENTIRYFNDIKDFPSLNKEEEKGLILSYQTNNDQKALEYLLKSNLRFVVTVAKTYQNQGVPLMDLIQEGNAGMVEAAKRFDVSRDIKFFSYAVWWIKIKIITNFNLHSRLIQIPANRVILFTKIRRCMAELEHKLQRLPTLKEIKVRFKQQSEEDIQEAIGFSLLPVSLSSSINTEGNDNDTQLIEVLSVENQFDVDQVDRKQSLNHDLNTLLYQLPQREYDIIVLSLGLNNEPTHRNEELGNKLKLKDKEIIKFRAKAIKLLKRFVGQTKLNEYL